MLICARLVALIRQRLPEVAGRPPFFGGGDLVKKNTRRADWKLKLNRETLQSLEKPQLERAVGASVFNTLCDTCPPTREPSCYC